MNEIKIRTWILWAVILFSAGVVADYFFWHLLLGQQKQESAGVSEVAGDKTAAASTSTLIDDSFIENPEVKKAKQDPTPTEKDNFLESLQKCAPEVAAQTIATPEALIEYLEKSTGVQAEELALENYHLTLPDGSVRRVHQILADNTNSRSVKELRFFKLDAEGYPERIPLKGSETLESLLAQGRIDRHEVKKQLRLKDGSSVSLETHDQRIFEFQFNNLGKILSCRYKECLCS